MKQLFRNIKLMSVMILAISLIGCDEDDTILPKVKASFTYTPNADTGVVTFINTSENATNYEWCFGDEEPSSVEDICISSTLINPVKAYPSGTYTVVLKAKNGAGDSDTFEDTITINIPLPIGFPVTFDDANVTYNVATFSGTAFDIVDNPDVSGSNDTASKVGAITNSGAAFEGIAFELGEAISLATEKTVKMDFWSDTPISILLKLEITESEFTQVSVDHGGTGWEELAFNFSASGSYPKVVIFVDGPGTTAGTFYFDNMIQEETPAPICDAETEESLNAVNLNMTFLSDPGTTATQGNPTGAFFQDNVTYEYVDNPDSSTDANRSCKVAKITKSGVQPWDNLQIDFDDKFIFTDGSNITLKVYSPVSGYNVTLKLEDKTNGDITSGDRVSTTSTTLTNAWEELTIPFGAGDSGIYDRLVIFFDLEGAANTNAYFIDDLKVNLGGGGGGGGDCVAETMQSLSPASDFNLTFMSDPGTTATQGSPSGAFFQDNVTYEYVDNPDFSMAENNSCKVGKITKSGVEAWDNLQIDFDEKFVFTDGSNFTIKVFSPVSGYKVTLKLEDKTNGDITTGDRASTTSTTLTNAWEELTIPFGAGDSGIYDRLVIFFDLEGAANTNAYYIDDLKLNLGSGGGGGGGGGGAAGDIADNGDFETGNLDGWAVYPNGGTIIADNTENNGGSSSGKIVASAPSGLNPTLKQERKGAGGLTVGDIVQVKFDYKGSAANGGIYDIRAFVEATDGVNQTEIFSVTPTDSWQTFTTTFTIGAGDIDGGISLQFTPICGGVDGCTSTLYLDNTSIIINP